MTYEEYQDSRKNLLATAKSAMDDGDKEGFDAAKADIEELDAKWNEYATMQANLDALNEVNPQIKPLIDLEPHDPKNIEKESVFDSVEYREAFMANVQKGTAIPEKFQNDIKKVFNAAATTTSSDASAVIPTTLVHEIIRKMTAYGNVYTACRHLNVQGGVEFPISDLIPTASWVTEAKASDDQKITANTHVTFSYYGLECKIAQSLLVSVASIAEFEDLFVTLATEAIVRAVEIGVFNGTGSGQMTGITVDTRIPSANVIEVTAIDIASWKTWKKNVFGKMKKAYRNGTFYMAQSTFDAYIDGMVDTNGQPIGRVNYGIDGGENYRFGGKTVETVEDDVITSFDDAATGTVFAVFGDLKNYAINSNLQMMTVKWIDHDSNTEKTKAIMIADGKVLDPNGFLVLKKKVSA